MAPPKEIVESVEHPPTPYDDVREAILADQGAVPNRDYGELYTALFVAANSGQAEEDYAFKVARVEQRKEMEDFIVSTLGPKGESYRQIVSTALRDIAASRYGYLPDPWTVNVGTGGDPIVLSSGEFHHTETDLVVRGVGLDFAFRRTYRNQVVFTGRLGANWCHAYELHVRELPDGQVDLTTGDLRLERFRQHAVHPYFVGPPGSDAIVTRTTDSFVRRAPDGVRHVYERVPSESDRHRVSRIEDRFGNAVAFRYRDDLGGALARVVVTHEARFVDFAYDGQGRVVAITDHAGRQWRYAYDDMNDLVEVVSPAADARGRRPVTRYEYDSAWTGGLLRHNLVRVLDPLGRTVVENTYGDVPSAIAFNRVVRQRVGHEETLFEYDSVDPIFGEDLPEPLRPVSATTVTTASGHQAEHLFDNAGHLLRRQEVVLEDGRIRRLVERYRYNRAGHVIASLSPEGSLTQFLYDIDVHDLSRPSTPEEEAADPDLTPERRRAYGRLLASVRRHDRWTQGADQLSPPVWGHFPDVLTTLSPGDVVTRYTYEPTYGWISTVSDPRFTTSADPRQPDPHPRHHETLQRFHYDGPANDPARHLVAVEWPRATLPDGSQSGPILQRSVLTSGAPAYDTRGQLLRSVSPTGAVTTFEYVPDAPGDPTSGFLRTTVADADGSAARTARQLDPVGNAIAVAFPKAVAGDDRFVVKTRYDVLDRPVETSGPGTAGPASTFDYDLCGNVERTTTTIVNDLGQPQFGGAQVARRRFDEGNELVREEVAAADGSVRSVTKHVTTRLGEGLVTILPRGNRFRTMLDRRSLPVARTDGFGSRDSATERRAYDGDRRLTRIRTAEGRVTQHAYDALSRNVRTTDPAGNVTVRDFDKRDQPIVVRLFEPVAGGFRLASRNEHEYDELGRPLRSIVNLFEGPLPIVTAAQLAEAFRDAPGPGDRLVEERWHDEGGRVVRHVDPRGEVATYEFDTLDRLTGTTDAGGTVTRHSFDLHGNAERTDVVEPAPDASRPPRAFSTLRTYDDQDRIVAVRDPLGITQRYAHDSRGFVVATTDALGRIVRTDVDLLGRITAVHELSSGATTTFEHDANGNVTAFVDPLGRRTSVAYDERDLRRVQVYADGSRVEFEYDRDDHLVATREADGVVRRLTVDALGRPARVSVELPAGLVLPGPTFHAFAYDARGNCLVESNDASTVRTRYTSTGWPVEETVEVRGLAGGPFTTTLRRRFDRRGDMIGMEYPTGRVLSYRRDGAGRAFAVENLANGPQYPGAASTPSQYRVFDVVWQGAQPVSVRRASGVSSAIGYDAGGRVLELRHSGSSSGLRLAYLYDAAGNPVLRHEGAAAAATVFGYDARDQLVVWGPGSAVAIDPATLGPPPEVLPDPTVRDVQSQMDALVASSTATAQVAYEYDLAGNRIAEHRATGTIATPANTVDQVTAVGPTALSYDAAGNLDEDSQFRFRYDAWQRLTRIARGGAPGALVEYVHDARGRAIAEVTAQHVTLRVHDGWDLIAEIREGAVAAEVVHLPGVPPVRQIASGGQEHWPVTDLGGNTRQVFASNGSPARAFDYEPFGALLPASSPPAEHDPLFAGTRLLPGTEIYRHASRVYVPRLGRYVQRDQTGYPEGTNPYSFARNNPLRFTDPMGASSRPAQSKWVFFRTKDGDITFSEESPTPYGSTRDMLKTMGFEIVDVPWGEVRSAIGTSLGKVPAPPSGPRRDPMTEVGEFFSEMIVGSIPPALVRPYVKDFYLADHYDIQGRVGYDAMAHMADRISRRWGAGGAREVDFWAGQLTALAGAGGEVAGGIIDIARKTKLLQRTMKVVQASRRFVTTTTTTVTRRLLTDTNEITQLFFGFRDEAQRLARRYSAQELTRTGQALNARTFGDYADAIFKAHVLQAMDDGVLPTTLHVTARYRFGPDVLDTATGMAWDLTTATVKEVAAHDAKYIGKSVQTASGSVQVRDVLPLVYTRAD